MNIQLNREAGMVQQADIPSGSASTYRRTREIALAAAWKAGLTRSLVDRDGQVIEMVYPGTWSHGLGPDFQGAMIAFPDGRLVSGDVELHHDASDWIAHGHDRDPRYADVILHVVSRPDLDVTRTVTNRVVPMAILTVPDDMLFRIDARLPDIWQTLGAEPCTAAVAARDPARLTGVLERLGDQRLGERVIAIEGDLACRGSVDVVTTLLLDAMGWSENRTPMRHLAGEVITHRWLVERPGEGRVARANRLLALLLGAGGFLPLSPFEMALARIPPDQVASIEAVWRGQPESIAVLPPSAWQRARTRPANHPVARIATAAALLSALGDDPVSSIVDAVRSGIGLDKWLVALTSGATAPLGRGRARAMTGTVLIPFVLALAHRHDDDHLADLASAQWETLRRSDWSRSADRARWQVAGNVPLRGIGERALQGLQTLDRTYCQPRRCYECSIAAERIRDEIIRPN
jgi:hypothetical protein